MSPKTPTLFYTLSAICAALSFPLVNALLMTRNAGNCSPNEFWYEPIRDCVPVGKQSFQGIPPYGTACPSERGWYWSNQLSVCLPTSPAPDELSPVWVSCPNHYVWDTTKSRCIHVRHDNQSSATCGIEEFWFSEKAMCLPRRDLSSLSTTRCPSAWYWSTEFASCAPANQEALSSLTCGSDLVWSPSTLMCQRIGSPSRRSPFSMPSGRPSPSPSPRQQPSRRNLKLRSASLCPVGLDPCPMLRAGDLSDYECIDPRYDLQHCGGCSIDSRGEDCTTIKGVWNVECVRARCSVLACTAGYVPSVDRRTCIKL